MTIFNDKNHKVKVRNHSGFTLIEILIVIVVLGILAMIIIPQITVSTEDAKLSTLQTNLGGIRSAIETYYAQHENKYPGEIKADGSAASGNNTDAEAAFTAQLTKYSAATGATSNSRDTTHKFGPYIKGAGFPTNPFDNDNDVKCDISVTDITVRVAAGDSAWKFYPKTGVFIANDTSENSTY